MANDNSKRPIKMGLINKIAQRLQNDSDALYRSTYYAKPDNKRQLDKIKSDINDSIKTIMDNNADRIGTQNISKLYERLMQTQNSSEVADRFREIFSDNEFVNNLANSYMDNRWVRALDTEIDEIIRYMPKLHEALMTIRDNVLSADSFSKDYLNLEANTPTKESVDQFSRNIDDMKDRYELLKLTSEIYDDESKYGEVFIYCVPYTKAIQRLMDRKDVMRNVVVKTNYHENSISISENGIVDNVNRKDVQQDRNDWAKRMARSIRF
jgi:hypothetical protein